MSRNANSSVAHLIDYAGTAAEDAAAYRGRNRTYKHRPEALVERLASALEFEAIDTYYGVLASVANGEVPGRGGISVLTEEDGTQTMTLSNGTVIEVAIDVEEEEPFSKAYVLAKLGAVLDPETSISNRLIDELSKEVDRQF